MPPNSGRHKGQNMFKAYLEEQNKAVINSLQLLREVIAQAY